MDTVLNCSFSGVSEFNLSELSLTDQDERFSNRTSLFPGQLRFGNASLLLKNVRVADEGSYSCFVRVQAYSSGAMLMQVAGNQPIREQDRPSHRK
ncbi:hypothetical protein PO909_032829 [Leuciscus waleckii]